MLITHPTQSSVSELIKFTFGHLSEDEFSARRQLITNLIDGGLIETNGFFVGIEGDVVVGVLISQLRPDGLVMIWHPAISDNHTIQPFFTPLDNYAKSHNAPAIILMADRDQIVDEKIFFENGFTYISDMLMLVSNLSENINQLADELLTDKNNSKLQFIPVSETNKKNEKNYQERLINLTRKTYVNTKDFPKLLMLSSAGSVLEEYQRNIFFRLELWFFVQKIHEPNQDKKDVGVLLLSDSPPEHIELTYMGLVEEERGKGYAQEIIKFTKKTAAACGRKLITTAVDEQNTTALKSYIKHGFITWDRKKIYAKIF
ncbi:MAG: GNAT family N-acetyltransferase [Planctomycetaceae bacterium]|jgi:GNAT superfamily N-acetyltransferase|nr:GNAT family N-acetyltransferase [Planctomycetaceae bacterium]